MKLSRLTLAIACATLAPSVLACSSCGCTLNADWASQGLKTGSGLSLGLRHDQFDQNVLRSGTGKVDTAAITYPTDQEIQKQTMNRNSILSLDYGAADGWGVNLQLPWIDRTHSTIAAGDTEPSGSASSSIGDLRVLGRYQGFSPERDWGLQFGLKLPTGAIDVNFNSGPQAGQPLDRGLQPGTGTTDLLLGAYRFGPLSQTLDFFTQVLLQQPLNSRDGFKPGTGVNLSGGVRWVGEGAVVPQLQLNARIEGRESGANADVANSGASLLYVSPGASMAVTDRLQAYGFMQVPIYQRVNGLQLEPKYSASIGLHYAY